MRGRDLAKADRPRVLLDTNLWSYVAEQGLSEDLVRLEHEVDADIVLQPAALMEALKHPVPHLRQETVGAMTARRRPTLRTEAALEASEFCQEVSRLRPAWARQVPDRSRVAKLDRFWQKQLWQAAGRDAGQVAARAADILRADDEVSRHLLQEQRSNQLRFRESTIRLNPSDLFAALEHDAPAAMYPGLTRGQRFEAWRLDFRSIFWHALVTTRRRALLFPGLDTTFADWVGPYVKLNAIARDEADFDRFCFYEVEAQRVPRNWLRWAANTVQLKYKLEQSSGWDAAQATYIMDCDLFLTADKRFCWALEAAVEVAPVKTGQPCLVEHHRPITDSIRDALAAQR